MIAEKTIPAKTLGKTNAAARTRIFFSKAFTAIANSKLMEKIDGAFPAADNEKTEVICIKHKNNNDHAGASRALRSACRRIKGHGCTEKLIGLAKKAYELGYKSCSKDMLIRAEEKAAWKFSREGLESRLARFFKKPKAGELEMQNLLSRSMEYVSALEKIILTYAKHGELEHVERLLEPLASIQQKTKSTGMLFYYDIVKAVADLGRPEFAEGIIERIRPDKVPERDISYGIVAEAYLKAGKPCDAERVTAKMTVNYAEKQADNGIQPQAAMAD